MTVQPKSRKRVRSASRPARVKSAPRLRVGRPKRITKPVVRRPNRAAALAAGTAVGVLVSSALSRRTFRADMLRRNADFHNAIDLSMVDSRSFSSWEDEISDLFERIGKLQEAAMLPTVGNDLDELTALVSSLPVDLKGLRQRGYVHQAQLEGQVAGFEKHWDQLYDQVADALYLQQTDLIEAANRLLDNVDRLYSPGASRGTVETCWAEARALQSRIEAAHRGLTTMYDDFSQELAKTAGAIDRVEWMLDQMEAAKFELLEGEAAVQAASAQWIRQGEDEGPSGILYLTDQRLLFEQKEEITTDKFLFIKLKTERVHEFKFAVPVSSIEQVRAEHREGFLGLGKTELIELLFDHTADLRSALFHLKKDQVEDWKMILGRVKSGEIDGERTGEAAVEAEELEQARRELPSNCPNCAAPLEQTIMRGMTSITCNFCGTVIRI